MNLPSFRIGCALVIACALLAGAGAQTSNWIAPLGGTYARWTDSSNWDNGVPNSVTAIASIPPVTSTAAYPVIAGAAIGVGEIRLNEATPSSGQIAPRVIIGDGATAGALTVSGAGISGIAGINVYNGTLEFTNSAVLQTYLGAFPYPSYLSARPSIRFSDHSTARGPIQLAAGRGGGVLAFADHSIMDGAQVTADTLGGSTVIFSGDSKVNSGSIYSRWGRQDVIVSDRADISGLSLGASLLGTVGGYTVLDLHGAIGPVAVRAVSGNVDVFLGDNTLIFGSLPAGRWQFDGGFSGSGDIRFERTNSGVMRISAWRNTHTGTTFIGSKVELANSGLHAVRIADEGQLTVISRGSVGQSLNVEQGTLEVRAPSGFDAQLSVLGSYSQSVAGVLRVPIQSTASVVIDGQATLNGQLDISGTVPTVDLGTHRFVLLTAGSISGRFASLTGALQNTAMLKTRLDYAADNVALLVEQQRFAEVGGATAATAALGQQIDLGLDTASGGYRDWIVALNRLATSAEVTASLANAAPDRLSVLAEEGFAQAAARENLLQQQLRAGDAVFFSGLRRERATEPKHSLPRAQSVTNGGVAGAAWSRGPIRFGAFVAREHTSFELDEQGSRATDSSTTPGLAFHFNHHDYFAEGMVAVTAHHYRWQRLVAAGSASAVATGVSRGREWDWALGAGRVFRLGHWEFVPAIGLLGSQWQMNDSTESSVGTLAYEFAHWENRSLRSRLDCEISYTKPAARWRPHLGLQWRHEFEPRRAIRGRMIASGGDYYLAPGRRGEIDEAQVRTGLDWRVTRSVTASAEATFSAGRTIRHTDSYSGSVRWQF